MFGLAQRRGREWERGKEFIPVKSVLAHAPFRSPDAKDISHHRVVIVVTSSSLPGLRCRWNTKRCAFSDGDDASSACYHRCRRCYSCSLPGFETSSGRGFDFGLLHKDLHNRQIHIHVRAAPLSLSCVFHASTRVCALHKLQRVRRRRSLDHYYGRARGQPIRQLRRREE